MIEINLLPEDKRGKIRALASASAAKPAVAGMPSPEVLKKSLYAVPAIVGVLLSVHLYLGIAQFGASMERAALEKKLASFQPQMTSLNGFKARFESVSQDEKVMQELAAKNIPWSKKLNQLSFDLPAGIWFRDLAANSRQLAISCSAVSLTGDQVELIKLFMAALRGDADFYGDFAGFDMGSVQKRTLGSFEVADFAVAMEPKPR